MPGGTAAAAVGTVAALRQLHDPPELVGVAAWHRGAPPKPFVPDLEVMNLRLPRFMLYWGWHRLRQPCLQRVVGEVDVIHATGMAVPPATAPLVVTVNDLAFMRYPDYFTARGRRFFYRSWQLSCAEADVIVCPSNHTLADCVAAGLPLERLRMVPYGVDRCAVSAKEVAEVRQRYGLAERFVLWVGTAEPRKNLSGLLAGWQMLGLSAEQLVLVGPHGWYVAHEAEIAACGGSVRRLGFVSEADKRALMAAAAVFCYPSWSEGFGLPVLEAMVQATPVITSEVGATKELVSDAALLVNPAEPHAIADAMASLLADTAGAERLGKQGQQRALSHYSWHQSAAALMAVYREFAI